VSAELVTGIAPDGAAGGSGRALGIPNEVTMEAVLAAPRSVAGDQNCLRGRLVRYSNRATSAPAKATVSGIKRFGKMARMVKGTSMSTATKQQPSTVASTLTVNVRRLQNPYQRSRRYAWAGVAAGPSAAG
jgi:hypothetical protein